MRHRLAVLSSLLLGSCVFHFSSPACWVNERDAFEVDRGKFTGVRCTTHNGLVSVAASDDRERVLVKVKKSAGAGDESEARVALAAIEVTHRQVDGKLVLGWRWTVPPQRGWHADVAFDVAQPRDLPISVETHNGTVRVVGMTAAVEAETHNGGLDLLDCSGAVMGKTHNGEIEARLSGRDVQLTTHNGSVSVALAGDGPVHGSVCSHNGPVRIDLAPTRTGRLVCRTDNGRVSCGRALSDVERGEDFLVGRLGEGDGRLEVETHNGSIKVN